MLIDLSRYSSAILMLRSPPSGSPSLPVVLCRLGGASFVFSAVQLDALCRLPAGPVPIRFLHRHSRSHAAVIQHHLPYLLPKPRPPRGSKLEPIRSASTGGWRRGWRTASCCCGKLRTRGYQGSYTVPGGVCPSPRRRGHQPEATMRFEDSAR